MSAVVKDYRELIAWQLADRFKTLVFELVRRSPGAERNQRYSGQLLDSAAAVSKDIVEGFKRFRPKVMMDFLDYALGSLHEAEERLRDGIELRYFRADECAEALRYAKRCTVAQSG
ncbi:MAG TPA: four helix bundle protein [Vicinamibacterales bacterium]|nr:four helix bundle protein [Vicinamibacterales bacterium]